MGFFGNVGRAIGGMFGSREQAPRIEDSPRFKRLLDLEALYWGEQYERRGLQAPWDKQPPGRNVPLRAQKPSAQYDLPRLVVDRPTALLFGEGRFPELALEPQVSGTDVTDANAWLSAIADEGELAHVMLTAARQGGALGTAVVTWAVVEGEFEFESHLALYCKPTFHAKKRRRLIALEKRYKFKQEVQVQTANGIQYQQKDFWHREDWDEEKHTVYVDVLVPADGSEPVWEVADEVTYGWGRCPAVWIKNLDDADPSEIDGVSLLEGISDLVEDIDRTLSQKSRAVRYNQDPERVYYGMTEEQVSRLRVGGGSTTLLPAKPAGDVALVELGGEGQRIAEEHVMSQRGRALETARVVVPDPDRLLAAARSGSALRMLFGPTLELVGELRSSYGRGMRDLLNQIVDAAREGKLTAVGTIDSPPPAEIPPGRLRLQWGRFFDPTPDDLNMIAQAAKTLSDAQILDHETLVRSIASYLGIKDVSHVIEKVKQEAAERAALAPPAPAGVPEGDTQDVAESNENAVAGSEPQVKK